MDDSLPARKRRKGGLRQRQASAKEAVSCPSELHELLMPCLAQGLLSAALVYNVGSAAQKHLQKTREVYLVTNLEQISNLKFGRNLTRSLESHLHSLADVPEPLSINIPLAKMPADTDSSLVLLPHEQFAHMFRSGEGWGASILPDAGALETFWSSFDHHPCMQGHPVLTKPTEPARLCRSCSMEMKSQSWEAAKSGATVCWPLVGAASSVLLQADPLQMQWSMSGAFSRNTFCQQHLKAWVLLNPSLSYWPGALGFCFQESGPIPTGKVRSIWICGTV